MAVPLLLALIWAAVLVPPALRAESRRRADFLVSFDRGPARIPSGTGPAGRPIRHQALVTRAQRRRQILGGLVVAMVATLLAGLLPPLRTLLIVHLFLVQSFLAYVALLVHLRRREDAGAVVARELVAPRIGRTLGAGVGRRTRMPDLPPLAGAWRD